MDIATIKLEIIRLISELQNERFLKWLLAVLKKKPTPLPAPPPIESKEVENSKLQEIHQIARQPIPESIDLEQLKREQGYDPARLAATLKNWDYSLFKDDPPAEEMIKMLSK